MRQKIEKFLQEQVDPILAAHRGGVELVDFKDNVAYVKLVGTCVHCMDAEETMAELVRGPLLAAMPELKGVELVEEIDPDLLEFARKILKKNKSGE